MMLLENSEDIVSDADFFGTLLQSFCSNKAESFKPEESDNKNNPFQVESGNINYFSTNSQIMIASEDEEMELCYLMGMLLMNQNNNSMPETLANTIIVRMS